MAALATPEELAAFLQQDLDTATATLALDLASAVVRNCVGQFIERTTSTVTLHTTDRYTQTLYLPQWPAVTVDSVSIAGNAVSDFTVLPNGLYRANGWVTGQTYLNSPVVVEVTYTHGYDPIPDDVKGATLYVAAQIYGNPSGATSFGIDDYRESRSESSELMPALMHEHLRSAYGGGMYVL